MYKLQNFVRYGKQNTLYYRENKQTNGHRKQQLFKNINTATSFDIARSKHAAVLIFYKKNSCVRCSFLSFFVIQHKTGCITLKNLLFITWKKNIQNFSARN